MPFCVKWIIYLVIENQVHVGTVLSLNLLPQLQRLSTHCISCPLALHISCVLRMHVQSVAMSLALHQC